MGIRKPFKVPGSANWYIDVDRKRQTTGTTDHAEAMKVYHSLLAGEQPPQEKPTLYVFVTKFLDWSLSTQSVYTYKSYRSALDKLQNAIGNVPVESIGPQQIDALVTAQLSSGLSRVSVNTMLRHIKGALGKAAEWYKLPRFKIKMLSVEKQPPRVLTAEQARAVLEQLDGPVRTLVLAYLCTGRRRQELLKLTWADVDKGGRRYFVRQKKVHLSAWFPMGKRFAELLEGMTEGKADEKVFGTLHPDMVTHQVKKALKACGHGHLHLHDLRHSFATMYLEAGGDVVALKNLLGHQQISTTMIYSHLSMPHLTREVDRVNV